LSDGAIGDAGGSGVVDADWCRWLRVSEIFTGGANWNSFFAVEEGGADFGFGGTGHDGLNDFGL
jgi:hypothetical protein